MATSCGFARLISIEKLSVEESATLTAVSDFLAQILRKRCKGSRFLNGSQVESTT
jgi:hypothetical protein